MSPDEEGGSWYVLRGSTVFGPHDVETLHRYLLLGRVRLSDRVSPDGRTWQPITQRAELIPEEMRDLQSEAGRARFEAAREAADERQQETAAAALAASARLRRRGEDDPAGGIPGGRWLFGALVIATAAVLVAIGYHETWLHGPAGPPDCEAAPGQGINWSYCTKDGLELPPEADLSGLRAVNASLRDASLTGVKLDGAVLTYADLTGANLAGANLRGADLDGAVLRGADLRNADLTDAQLDHADLRDAKIGGARFDGADATSVVWPDGGPCPDAADGNCP